MRAQFVLSEIGVGLRRNLTMTFAVIISVALSLALTGGALLANKQVDSMRRRVVELEFGRVVRDEASGVYGIGR